MSELPPNVIFSMEFLKETVPSLIAEDLEGAVHEADDLIDRLLISIVANKVSPAAQLVALWSILHVLTVTYADQLGYPIPDEVRALTTPHLLTPESADESFRQMYGIGE